MTAVALLTECVDRNSNMNFHATVGSVVALLTECVDRNSFKTASKKMR